MWKIALAGVLLVAGSPLASAATLDQTDQASASEFITGISAEEMVRGVAQFASMGSRVPGYPGHEAASELVKQTLDSLGLTYVHTETFEIASPIELGATLVSDQLDEPIQIHALWPNVIRLVTTPPGGTTGELIYVGKGEIKDLNGFQLERTIEAADGSTRVERAVVLMDFNTGDNYLRIRALGAGAILLVEPEDGANRKQAEKLVLQVPLDVPRFWVSRDQADRLLKVAGRRVNPTVASDLRVTRGAVVTIDSRMAWRNVPGRNYTARLDGIVPPLTDDQKAGVRQDWEDLGNELIVLTANYDSTSVVPALAPGADQACGIVALLTLAERLAAQRHGVDALCDAAPGLKDDLGAIVAVGLSVRKSLQLRDWTEARRKLETVLTSAASALETCRAQASGGPSAVRPLAARLAGVLDAANAVLGEMVGQVDQAVAGDKAGDRLAMVAPLDAVLKAVGREVQVRPVLFVATDAANFNHTGMAHWMVKHIEKGIFDDQIYMPSEIRLTVNEAIEIVDAVSTALGRLDGAAECADGFVGAMAVNQLGRGEAWDAAVRSLGRLHAKLVADGIRPTPEAGLSVLAEVGKGLGALKDARLPLDANGDCPGYWLFDPEAFRRGREYDFKLLLDLNLSSQANVLASVYSGQRGAVLDIKRRRRLAGYAALLAAYEAQYHALLGGKQAELIEPFYANGVTPVAGRSFESLMPDNMALASNAAVDINLPGMSLVTAYDPREHIDTPSDVIDAVDGENLAQQVRTVAVLLREAMGDPAFVTRGYRRSVIQKYKHGFVSTVSERKIGESVIANFKVPNALVVMLRSGKWTGVRREIIGLTNDAGKFWTPFYFIVKVKQYGYQLDKFGNIIKAADRGNEGDGTYKLESRNRDGKIVLFKCRSLDVYDNLDTTLIKNLNKVNLFDKYNAPPPKYGYNMVDVETTVPPGHVVFFEPHQHIKVCLSRSFWGFQYLLLNTVSGEDEASALGLGFSAKNDRRATVFRCAERVTEDIVTLNTYRLNTLGKYGIRSEMIQGMVEKSSAELAQAMTAFGEGRYDAYVDGIRRARGYAVAGYPLIKGLERDTVQGIVLYFALLIPFAFFCERLLFGFPDIKRQVIAIGAIFVGVFVIMRLVHPAFMISQSPYVIFLAFIILALAVLVLWIVVGRFNEQMAEMKRESSKIHHTDVGRMSASYAAMMLGIGNMRKRRLRTALTTATLVLITYAVLSFTSLSSYTHFFELPIEASPSYNGAMIRDRQWQLLEDEWVDYVKAAYPEAIAVVAPRAWFHSTRDNPLNQKIAFDRVIEVEPSAIVSIPQASTGEEATNFEALLLTAGGAKVAWPRDDQDDVCVMAQGLADRLDLKPDDVGGITIRLKDKDLLLAGILAQDMLDGSVLAAGGAGQGGSLAEALFVSRGKLAELGDQTVEVSVQPGAAAKIAGQAGPVAGVGLVGLQRPAVVKLGQAAATGFIGMTPDESKVSGINRDGRLSVGRWLSSRSGNECVIPDVLARRLNITDEDVLNGSARIRAFAETWQVAGILRTDRLETFFELDGGLITPLEPERTKPNEGTDEAAKQRQAESANMASTELKDYRHLDPGRVVFLPYDRVKELGGGVYSIGVGFHEGKEAEGTAATREFLERSAALVFVAENGKTRAITSMGRTGVSGLSDLIVPILIGAFIIVNTMMGSVYERHREIGVYSAVGLAPVHISALFIAESFVYAVMGAIIGYLIGQISASFIVRYEIAGVELNYSSASTVLATLLVMGVVLLSAVYPSRMASAMAVPDVTRHWVLSQPEGDNWHFQFPFTVPSKQVLALFVFLNNWFDGYREESVGAFYTTELDFHAEGSDRGQAYVITLTMWLSPFDRGVSQRVRFRTMPTEDEGVSQVEVNIERLSGEHGSWYRLNRRFLKEVRKQFLIFRTVPMEVKEAYAEEGAGTLGVNVEASSKA